MTDIRPAPDDEERQLPPGQRLAESMRVMHYGRVPRLDLEKWHLRITGETHDGEGHDLDWRRIGALPQTTLAADHHCVSRRSVLDVTWSGVLTRDLLALVPPADGAEYVLLSASYGYSTSVTVADLAQPRSLLATGMNGEPLAPEHGWPARIVFPHLYGWKGPKWVLQIEYTRHQVRGFWEQKGYHIGGDVWREERYAHQE